MNARASLLVLTTLSLLLTACAEKQTTPVGAAAPKAATARKAAINASLSARCPTPGGLQPWELDAVAMLLGKSPSPALVRLAGEYDRLDDEAVACRGGVR